MDAGAVAEKLRTLTSAATPSGSHSANFISDQQNERKVYEAIQYSPAWVREGQATPQAIAVISAIESSRQKGLNPEDYDASHWPERMAALKAAPGNADTVANFDAALTVRRDEVSLQSPNRQSQSEALGVWHRSRSEAL